MELPARVLMATIMPSHKTLQSMYTPPLILPACTPGPHQGQRAAIFLGEEEEGWDTGSWEVVAKNPSEGDG